VFLEYSLYIFVGLPDEELKKAMFDMLMDADVDGSGIIMMDGVEFPR